VTEDWTVRPAAIGDRRWVASSLRAGLERNSYFHGVDSATLLRLTGDIASTVACGSWQADIVCTGDDDKEPAGWVIYRQVPTMTIAYAHVDEAFRGLGAWRCLRNHLGLRDGQLVGVVLASPQAMATARKRYQAKHNWGMVLEWL
jgi:hypothetical protein